MDTTGSTHGAVALHAVERVRYPVIVPRLCIVALCGAASLFAVQASAQTAPIAPPMMRLEWVRGAGAERCPSTPVIARAVEARIGRPLFAMDAPQSVEVSIQRAAQQWSVAIFLRDRDGALLGSRALSSEQPDCEAVASSVIFSIALAIDPEAALRPQSQTASSTAGSTTAAAPQTSTAVESAPIPSAITANAIRAIAAALTQSALTSSLEAQRAHLRERQESDARIRAEDAARAAQRAAIANAPTATAGNGAHAAIAQTPSGHTASAGTAARDSAAPNGPLVAPPIAITPPPPARAVLGAGSVALGAWVNWGLLPLMAAGPTLEGYARIYQRIGVRGALRWLPEQEIDTAPLGLVSFGLVAGQIALDVELYANQRWSLSAYGGALLSAIHAIVHDRAPADTGERFSLDLGLGASGALHLYGPLSLQGSLELATPLIRYRYRVEGDLSSTVYEQPWVTVGASVALGARFR